MKGTSGFQEVRYFTSRSPAYRFLNEQWHQFVTGAWHLLRTHDVTAFSTDISTKREKAPDLFLKPRKIWSGVFQVMKARDEKMSKVGSPQETIVKKEVP